MLYQLAFIRKGLSRGGAVAWLAALLLLQGVLAPLELVWCSERGESVPRLEPALNGACLAQAVDSCCAKSAVALPAIPAAAAPAQLVAPCASGLHCRDCSDELAGGMRPALRARVQSTQIQAPPDGCLFVLGRNLLFGCDLGAALLPSGAHATKPPDLLLLPTLPVVLRI